eukprot:2912572-Rhodomonas_salina.2
MCRFSSLCQYRTSRRSKAECAVSTGHRVGAYRSALCQYRTPRRSIADWATSVPGIAYRSPWQIAAWRTGHRTGGANGDTDRKGIGDTDRRDVGRYKQ